MAAKMDFYKSVLTLHYMVLACLITAGVTHGQWSMNDEHIDGPDEADTFSSMERREFSYPSYNLESDWNAIDSDGDENSLANYLKRSVFHIPENYRRFPRIQQHITPFYTYGKVRGQFRSKSGYGSRLRKPYLYKIWNMDGLSSTKKHLRKHIYDTFKK